MMTGTDLEVQLVAEVDLQAPAEQDGEITVPARKLMDIWRALPDGAQVSFSVDEQRATLKSGRSRFQLATLPAAEFPTLEEGTTDADFTLSQAQLRQLISKTSFSMAQQDVRYFLNGMLLELAPAHIRSVATDGHRLAMCTLTPGPGAGPERQVIVPRKGVLELARLIADGDDPVALSLGTHHLSAKVGGSPSPLNSLMVVSPTMKRWFLKGTPPWLRQTEGCCEKLFYEPPSFLTKSTEACAWCCLRKI